MYEYAATVERVVDGDTLYMMVDVGFDVHVRIDARLAHVNTPEIEQFGVNGPTNAAKEFVEKALPPGSLIVVRTSRQGKYGRWLAVVTYMPGRHDAQEIIEHGSVLNDELVKRGLAKPYEGGKK